MVQVSYMVSLEQSTVVQLQKKKQKQHVQYNKRAGLYMLETAQYK